eukprot:2846334-Amphidinium_carterae.1
MRSGGSHPGTPSGERILRVLKRVHPAPFRHTQNKLHELPQQKSSMRSNHFMKRNIVRQTSNCPFFFEGV